MRLVDSHCHLNMLSGGDEPEGVQRYLSEASDNGVNHFLNVSVDLESFPEVLHQAEMFKNVYASVGIHPNYTPENEPSEDEIIRLSQHPKVIAIGETGLDYFRADVSSQNTQKIRFQRHIHAAKQSRKPLIIHMREATKDTLDILRTQKTPELKGVMHCFVEDWATARQAIDLGFMISISGIVTFKNALALKEVVKKIPGDYLLVETDAPYLAPVPHRGKENRPAYVRDTAQYIADLRGTTLERVAEITTENFCRLFGLNLN